MDWLVVTAIASVAAYVGFVSGVLLSARVDPGRPGGEGPPPDPLRPATDPSGSTVDDFTRWERELSGQPSVRS
jgi:hypothetical protein